MASKFAYRYRKPVSSVGVGVRGSATEADADTPTITSGTGTPTATEPNGSLYMQTDAAGPAAALWIRSGGSWAALDGS